MAKQTIIYGSFVSVYFYLLCFFNFCLLNLFIYVVLGYHVLWWNKVVFNSPQPVKGPSKRKKIRGPRARAQCAHWLRRPWHSQHTKHAITWEVHRKRSHLGVLHACDAPDSCPNVKSTACARHLKQSHQPPPPTTRQYLCFSCFGGLVIGWLEKRRVYKTCFHDSYGSAPGQKRRFSWVRTRLLVRPLTVQHHSISGPNQLWQTPHA